ncbi:NUDIX domain-containing protein [Gelidibacter salicanalis]|uniref:NUDIX domain-containing protein n=1 Tax=Gelidibacter salicanalis TaxID=291193 RepID=A0A5C7ACM2_9FLAO|nr:NUDIX domain-containing protein [Gelidibacter salicanalis]TXE06550.1 NUDIX domain-containing protein [Gelidibacter salicanalis]
MEAEEYIAILNADGSPTGKTCLKSEIHHKGYYHNTAHVWFYNDHAEILLAQRAANKVIYPLLWDISVAGHVDAGETIAQAAIRETREEIGLEITEQDLLKVGVYDCFQSYPNGIVDNEFHHTYIAKINKTINDLKLDPEEVQQAKFVSIPEFLELLNNSANNSHFVQSNTNYYLEVIKAIENQITNTDA